MVLRLTAVSVLNSDAVTYYATFDNYMVGTKQGEYIESQLNLKSGAGPFNIELITGDPGDNNARFFWGGAMEVLQPYIDNGQLVVRSGQTDFETCATANWATENAQNRFDAIISAYYSDGTTLDAVMASNDSTAQGVTTSLENNYTGAWPIITGQDCDIVSVQNMIAGKQSMSIFKDTLGGIVGSVMSNKIAVLIPFTDPSMDYNDRADDRSHQYRCIKGHRSRYPLFG